MMIEIALLWCHPFVTQAAEGNTGLISYPIAPGYLSLKAQSSPSAGPRLNIKTVLSTYGEFHVKDKTAVRTSYF